MNNVLKYGCFFLVSTSIVWAAPIKVGTPRDEVLSCLGEPQGRMQKGERETLLYPNGVVVLEQGCVISSDEALSKNTRVTIAGPGSHRRLFERRYEKINQWFAPGSGTAIPLSELPGSDAASFRVNAQWLVSVVFLNDIAEVLSYSARNEQGIFRHIEPDEFDALLKKHANGMKWRRQRAANTSLILEASLKNFHGSYVRDDGVLALSNGPQMRIETPVFRKAVSLAEQKREHRRLQLIPGAL